MVKQVILRLLVQIQQVGIGWMFFRVPWVCILGFWHFAQSIMCKVYIVELLGQHVVVLLLLTGFSTLPTLAQLVERRTVVVQQINP